MKNFNTTIIEDFPAEPGDQSAEDFADRVAEKIVEIKLTVPALLFLELHRPLGTFFHTSALFAQPFVSPFLGAEKVNGFIEFLNNPENLGLVIRAIERKRDAAKS